MDVNCQVHARSAWQSLELLGHQEMVPVTAARTLGTGAGHLLELNRRVVSEERHVQRRLRRRESAGQRFGDFQASVERRLSRDDRLKVQHWRGR